MKVRPTHGNVVPLPGRHRRRVAVVVACEEMRRVERRPRDDVIPGAKPICLHSLFFLRRNFNEILFFGYPNQT